MDGFAIDKMAAEVKVRTKDFILDRKYQVLPFSPPGGRRSSAEQVYPTNISSAQIQTKQYGCDPLVSVLAEFLRESPSTVSRADSATVL